MPTGHAMKDKRIWYPFTFEDGNSRVYRVSFLLAEEATWDHRFHDLDGREIAAQDLRLSPLHLRYIQASCDGAVGDCGVIARLRRLPLKERVDDVQPKARRA